MVDSMSCQLLPASLECTSAISSPAVATAQPSSGLTKSSWAPQLTVLSSAQLWPPSSERYILRGAFGLLTSPSSMDQTRLGSRKNRSRPGSGLASQVWPASGEPYTQTVTSLL